MDDAQTAAQIDAMQAEIDRLTAQVAEKDAAAASKEFSPFCRPYKTDEPGVYLRMEFNMGKLDEIKAAGVETNADLAAHLYANAFCDADGNSLPPIAKMGQAQVNLVLKVFTETANAVGKSSLAPEAGS